MTVDDEQSLDSFVLTEMHGRISTEFERAHGNDVKLCAIQAVSSRNSPLIQLADLIAGAINRKMNHKGEKNYKDDMAEKIIHTLDLSLTPGGISGLDATAVFNV